MAKEEAQKSKKPQNAGNKNMLIAAAAVIIVLAAAYVYFGNGTAPPPAPQQPGQKASQLETASAKLLLASFDKGAALKEYFLNYTTNEGGAESRYEISSDGTDSWVRESADFGSREGFFGKDNKTDVLCLKYGGEKACAQMGNDSDAAGVASDLKTLLPNEETFTKQKENLRKHIAAGAINFNGDPAGEKAGQFDAMKVSYLLNYRDLTVQQLIAIGVSPNDPSITSITDQTVTYWIDRKSGIIVKSVAEWKQNLIPRSYAIDYAEVDPAAARLPEKPSGVIETKAFVNFYAQSVQDYQGKMMCLAQPQPDRDLCFKSLAASRNDWDLCKKISNPKEYESCTLIVAQNTNNKVLCANLSALGDDCYISIAGKTGNTELCKMLSNQSLGANCTQIAVEGKKAEDAKELDYRKRMEAAECKADTDCRIAGNANQYCVPTNTTGSFSNETSAAFACLKGVPCSCNEGFCGFAKDDPYYACVSRLEDKEIRNYINSLNSTNSSG